TARASALADHHAEHLVRVVGGDRPPRADAPPPPRPRRSREMQRHAPVGDVGVIERRLERLVLDEEPLVAFEQRMSRAQVLLEPLLARADALRARIIPSVREPERRVPAAHPAAPPPPLPPPPPPPPPHPPPP